MSKILKSSIDHFFDYSLHVETRTIYIGDQIDEGEILGVGSTMAELAIKAFHLFNQTPDKAVTVILNTFGGCWFNGLGIYNTIKSSPCKVTIDVVGPVMSMGSIILQAGDVRRAHKDAVIMVHDGDEFMSKNVPPKTFEAWAAYSKKVARPRMYEIYATRSGRPVSYWEKRCAHDYILTADEAKEEGLIDEVIET